MSKPQILSDTKLPPAQMFDVRNADGQIVHVNIEDINQFLTYHEVFGKIGNTDHPFPVTSNTLTIPSINASAPVSNAQTAPIVPPTSMNQPNSQSQSTPLIIPKIENTSASISNTISVSTATTSTCVTTIPSDDSSTMPSPGMHTCDICGKVFAFKYQFIGEWFEIFLFYRRLVYNWGYFYHFQFIVVIIPNESHSFVKFVAKHSHHPLI